MPNVKIYVDDTLWRDLKSPLVALLPDLRARLCAMLGVAPAISQLAVIPVCALADQPALNVELQILASAERPRTKLLDVAQEVRDMLGAATGHHVAVRLATLQPDGYVTLK